MVVRKNVLEYIIALVVVKNKVRLKKCLKIFQIWQNSIVQINLSITSLRLILNFRPVFDDQCPRGGSRGEGATGASPYPIIRKNMIFWRKIVIFHTKYPKHFF